MCNLDVDADRRNLKRIARELGEKLTDEELRGMIDAFRLQESLRPLTVAGGRAFFPARS